MPELRRADGVTALADELPIVALRDLVFFPYMVLPLLIGRTASLSAVHEAKGENEGASEAQARRVLLLAQRDPTVDEPTADDLFRVGTVAEVVSVTPLLDGTSRVVFEGLGRVRVRAFAGESNEVHPRRARVERFVAAECDHEALGLEFARSWSPARPEDEASWRMLEREFSEYCDLHAQMPEGLARTILEGRDRTRAIHLMAGHLLVQHFDKQPLLEASTRASLIAGLRSLLAKELEVLRIEAKLEHQIHTRIDGERRRHYLTEQLRAIQGELGRDDESECDDLERSIQEAGLPEQVRRRAERDLGRLRRLNPVAPEAAVLRGWLEWVAALPWNTRSAKPVTVAEAAALLDREHYGLDEIKDRVLDQLAVLTQTAGAAGPVLCLVGPPGVGKTSLARSIACALGREFVRVSLGGVRDEAEIRGHRRTYVGALPGRIVQGMRRAGTRDPVFLLDEIDKLATDRLGDPGSALLEVLDPEQNSAFTDHYLELDFDLSDVVFVATANTLSGIPEPLRDRLEVIRLPGYLDTEKLAIAERFIWPAQARAHGLDPSRIRLAAGTIEGVIEGYTREAGVRELTRRLARLARKVAREFVERPAAPERRQIEVDELVTLLGPAVHIREGPDEGIDRVGIAQGLAWTAAGGEVLDVEVAVVPGTGGIRLTGTMGEVMKESAMAALTWTRARSSQLGLAPDFHEHIDVHVHIPEGATPKDGPSAGVTMAIALVSALTGIPTRTGVALTGELTLRGRVLGVGGVREKIVAARREGLRQVVLPVANRNELEQLPPEVHEGVQITTVASIDELLELALERRPRMRMHTAIPGTSVHAPGTVAATLPPPSSAR